MFNPINNLRLDPIDPLDILPSETWHHVLSFLKSPKDNAVAKSVCRLWHALKTERLICCKKDNVTNYSFNSELKPNLRWLRFKQADALLAQGVLSRLTTLHTLVFDASMTLSESEFVNCISTFTGFSNLTKFRMKENYSDSTLMPKL